MSDAAAGSLRPLSRAMSTYADVGDDGETASDTTCLSTAATPAADAPAVPDAGASAGAVIRQVCPESALTATKNGDWMPVYPAETLQHPICTARYTYCLP